MWNYSQRQCKQHAPRRINVVYFLLRLFILINSNIFYAPKVLLFFRINKGVFILHKVVSVKKLKSISADGLEVISSAFFVKVFTNTPYGFLNTLLWWSYFQHPQFYLFRTAPVQVPLSFFRR